MQKDEALLDCSSDSTGGSSDGRQTDPGGDEGRPRTGEVHAAVVGRGLGNDQPGGVPRDELGRLAEDLLKSDPDYGRSKPLTEAQLLRAQFPAEPPGVRALHPDCQWSTQPVGYSEEAMNTRIHPLCRKRYPEFVDAKARFDELGFVQVGEAFQTATFWCFRVRK